MYIVYIIEYIYKKHPKVWITYPEKKIEEILTRRQTLYVILIRKENVDFFIKD